MRSREIIEKILVQADVKINGNRPWDIKVHNEKLYDLVLSKGTLGLGEAYMDGWWDCDALDEMFFRTLRAGGHKVFSKTLVHTFQLIKSKILNLQTKAKSKKVADIHYDIS